MLNFNTTFKITYDIVAIILIILAVLFFLKDKKERKKVLQHNKRPFIYLKGLFLIFHFTAPYNFSTSCSICFTLIRSNNGCTLSIWFGNVF
ncbi:hypothetical protein CN958_17645 [Bacillus cereus]|uniref:Uncharacterized protein n=1 Tax=Bacillus cereus TaxID=1396 RepID=A0A2B9DXA6_BACCE|nr:hypothetical protein CN958_17645 [Bacillus cereus]